MIKRWKEIGNEIMKMEGMMGMGDCGGVGVEMGYELDKNSLRKSRRRNEGYM